MDTVGDNSKAQLRGYVERIEALIEERVGINDDIKDIFTEVKAAGFDVPVLRQVIARRAKLRKDRAKVTEREAVAETYHIALGDED